MPTRVVPKVRKSLMTIVWIALGLLGWSGPMACPADEAKGLADVLRPLCEAHANQVAVSVRHLKTGESFDYRADEPMPTASLIKFPLMISAYKRIDAGELSLDKPLTLKEAEKVPGSGILSQNFSPGLQLTLRDTIHLMIVFSDNTATNMVVDEVGLANVAQDMEALGCPETKLHSKVFRRDTSLFPERSQRFGLGSTTASEMARLLTMLSEGKLVSETASTSMYKHLLACEDRTKIGRGLPATVKFAHKTGEVSTSKADAGIIESPSGPIVICVLTQESADRKWGDADAARAFCEEIGHATYAYFHPDDESPAPTGRLVLGSAGPLVESLQRTLNARLTPSPGLSVDGDFGPMTQSAVIRFQELHQLKPTGEVDEAFWKALGVLLSEEAAVPSPEEIAKLPWELGPPDEVSGIPYVTAQAWAILDGKTGKPLAGFNEHARRETASTTKIMTAHLVVRLADKSPEVLREVVTFSRRADLTEGSTSGVREGESLTVDELLYGLLLPSGNDAAVALGEHFAGRPMGEATAAESRSSRLERFVAAMNARAKELGMRDTHYQNPHGLPDPEHLSTAADLGTLSWQAMQSPIFRKYVATPRRGCTVEGPGGYRRNLLWNNTNRLLAITGYAGVKTGTTNAAGACLVGYGKRGDAERLIVILGSSASDGRYADIRNLFRWSWSLDGA